MNDPYSISSQNGILSARFALAHSVGELARYDHAPTHGGISKSYGHLVSAVVNSGATALIFEDAKGVIRFVTLTGVTEGELTRE